MMYTGPSQPVLSRLAAFAGEEAVCLWRPLHKQPKLAVRTQDGPVDCHAGDWVVRDRAGRVSVCKGELFDQFYEVLVGKG